MKLGRFIPALTILLTLAAGTARAEEKMEAPKKAKSDLAATLEANERKVNDAIKSKDAKVFMDIVDHDAWMVDASGVNAASMMVDMMKDLDLRNYTIADYKVLPIDRDAVIATYTWTGDQTFKGQAYPAGPWYCSTVWRKHGNDWKAIYHQETMSDPAAAQMMNH